MNRRGRVLLLLFAVGAATELAGPAIAASLPGPEQRVLAMDDDPSDWFGLSVALGDSVVVIGAPAPGSGAVSGKVYVNSPGGFSLDSGTLRC